MSRLYSVCDEFIGHVHHEQRITIGTPVNEVSKFADGRLGKALTPVLSCCCRRGSAKPLCQIFAHCSFTQKVQRQLFTPPMHLQLLLDSFQRMVAAQYFHWAITANN